MPIFVADWKSTGSGLGFGPHDLIIIEYRVIPVPGEHEVRSMASTDCSSGLTTLVSPKIPFTMAAREPSPLPPLLTFVPSEERRSRIRKSAVYVRYAARSLVYGGLGLIYLREVDMEAGENALLRDEA